MHGQMSWRVKDKLFVWERPLRQSDLKALGDDAPSGEILGARVEHEGAKLALIESEPEVYFTIPHFDGYSAVLVLLEKDRRRGARGADHRGVADAGAEAARRRISEEAGRLVVLPVALSGRGPFSAT